MWPVARPDPVQLRFGRRFTELHLLTDRSATTLSVHQPYDYAFGDVTPAYCLDGNDIKIECSVKRPFEHLILQIGEAAPDPNIWAKEGSYPNYRQKSGALRRFSKIGWTSRSQARAYPAAGQPETQYTHAYQGKRSGLRHEGGPAGSHHEHLPVAVVEDAANAVSPVARRTARVVAIRIRVAAACAGRDSGNHSRRSWAR